MGPCAKARVICTLVTQEGDKVVGENLCLNPQSKCPRESGEGYEKCSSICRQIGHAEEVAIRLAGSYAKGAEAYLEGHTYACKNCQEIMFGAGVRSLSVSAPPSSKGD